MLLKKLKLPLAEELGDDVILQQIDAEEAAKIEDERATVPEEAILEPYSEVEDVAGNVLIELLLKDSYAPASNF